MPPSTGWPIRTSYAELKPASWFLAHPLNLAIHPQAQQDYLAGSLDELGWVKPVIVNRRTSPEWGPEQGVETLLDGHARIREALRAGDDTPVPLDWVDLPPNLEEIALMVLDQMVTYRVLDKEKLALLAASATPQNTALQEMCAAMCEQAGLGVGNGTALGDDVEPPVDRPSLADRFVVPPFSVLDARQGYWQTRKRAWLALGIQSELGRGENALGFSEGVNERHSEGTGPYGKGSTLGAIPPNERAILARSGKYKVSPGGSPRPAASLGPDGNPQRDDGHGRPLHAEASD